ncbi:MAG: helix-turn-helix domain-containing protein [Deltaproteobacteria bacterium]|nr:helix-turn-helix domain-containing protein [Deltaproteobacteria bacterium]
MARGPKPQQIVRLNAKEYEQLQHMARLRKAPHAEVVRAKILLLAYEHPDWDNATIARKAGCTDRTVRQWRKRSREGPLLQESPRCGAPRFFSLNPKSPSHRSGLHASAR